MDWLNETFHIVPYDMTWISQTIFESSVDLMSYVSWNVALGAVNHIQQILAYKDSWAYTVFLQI